MLKAAGLLGIVLSLGLLGILKSQELKQRIALLQDFWQMMLQLKSEINYLQEPLQSVLRQRPGNAESKAMQLLPAVQQALDAKRGNGLQGDTADGAGSAARLLSGNVFGTNRL